jgi:two-component system cell cycle response regulator
MGVQRFWARAGVASALACCAGLWLLDQHSPLPAFLSWVAAISGGLGLFAAARRRWRPGGGASLGRLDFELSGLALLLALVLVDAAPGGLEGSFSGLLYVGFALLAARARPRATLAAWGLLLLLLVGRGLLAERGSLWDAVPLAACVGLASGVAYWFSRQQLERARQQRREEVDRELEKLRAEARDYRLTHNSLEPASGVRSGFGEGLPVSAGDDDSPLLRSSVDEIHAALRSALGVCRVALDCRSVLVFWRDDAGARLAVRAASTSERSLLEGPFGVREGLFAAAFESDRLVELVGSSANRPLPYYPAPLRVGHVALLPLFDEEKASGLLVLDRQLEHQLTAREREIVDETARLCLRTIDNERVLLQLERAKLEQGRLYRAVERLNEARTEVQVIEAGVGSAADFAAFQFAAVTLLRGDGQHEICAVSGDSADALVGKTFRDSSGLVGMVVANRHPLPYRGQCGADVQILFTRSLPAPRLPSLLVMPLLVHREVLGTLILGSEAPGGFEAGVRLILQVLAGHIAVSLANARMVKRLEELATTDGLTGLLNKRAATELGRQKLRAAERFHKPLSLIVCDLDHFKRVNDTHGHDVGDRVIKGFADVLRRVKRETDIVGRFGGEEFVLVCEQTDAAGAELLGERIRGELGATTFSTPGGTLRTTCSIGVATYPHGGTDWEVLFKASDEALYASKRAGRDRVTCWTPRLDKAKAG